MLSVLKSAVDAHVYEGNPTENYGRRTFLAIREGGSLTRRIYIWFGRPFPIGATIASATLYLWTRSDFSDTGPHTLTVRRVSGSWKESGVGGITWAAVPAIAGATVSESIGSPAADTEVSVDVTDLLAEAATGSDYFGLRVATNINGYERFHSAEAADATFHPRLEVTWSTAPGEPTDLRPSGGRAVGVAQPTFTWSFNDADGDEQSAYQFQLDTVSTFATPDVDTGYVVSADQQKALSEISLSAGTTYYWRVRAKDDAGVASEWSDAQEFTYDTKGTLSITDPGATYDATTLTVTHTFTGETQAAIRYRLFERDETDDNPSYVEVYDSGIRKTAATTFTLLDDDGEPLLRGDGTQFTYKLQVRVWDTKNREATPGDPRYVQDTQEFTYTNSGAPAAVTSLTVTTDGSPAYTLTWTRSSAPDFFAVKVDDRFPKDYRRLDPADVLVSGTTYQTKIWELDPGTSHTFEVEAVVNGEHSSGNDTDTASINPGNAWLVVPKKNLYVPVFTDSQADYSLNESAEMFFPVGRRDPVRITDAMRGYEGTVSGSLGPDPYLGLTGKQWRSRLENVKSWARKGEKVVLVHGDRQFPIALGDISVVPRVGTNPPSLYFAVTFQFWQIGDFRVANRA